MDFTTSRQPVVIVGAGPAGLFAARFLATNHVPVILLNRDIKPGGLAEYGIYYNKYKMKAGLRKQFHQILNMPEIEYFGNVTVGENGNLSLDDIRDAGCQTILITAGAQGTKWLGLPGEDLDGVYHAKILLSLQFFAALQPSGLSCAWQSCHYRRWQRHDGYRALGDSRPARR
jgi:ferredoxin--NADP+ reductase